MKANELRIGNYVKINGVEIGLTPALFCLIIDNQIVPSKPIPLTEDILLKFGFEKLPIDSFIKNNIELSFLDSRNFAIYCNRPYTEIKYLHQLQNLYFALTNQELEINL